ncbi:MAG: PAS domain S-box protein, partial [Planctomycetia bacterium]
MNWVEWSDDKADWFRLLPRPMAVVRSDGIVLAWTKSMERLTEAPAAQMVSVRLTERLDEDGPQVLQALFDTAVGEVEAEAEVGWVVRAAVPIDGVRPAKRRKVRRFQAVAARLPATDDGRPLFGVTFEYGRSVRVEPPPSSSLVRRSAVATPTFEVDPLAMVLGGSPSAAAHLDRSGVVRYVNAAFGDLFGEPTAELVGRTFPSFFPIEAQPGARSVLRIVAHAGVFRGVLTARRGDESNRFPVEATLYRIDDPGAAGGSDGTRWPVGSAGSIVVLEDWTLRQQAEDDLRESEERLEMVLRSGNEGWWDWNIETSELFLSQRWKAILGFHEHEIANRFDEWMRRIHPHDVDRMNLEFSRRIEGRRRVFEFEQRLLHKDGAYRWVELRGLAVVGRDGRTVRAAGSIVDVTPRKETEEALARERRFTTGVFEAAGALMACVDMQGRLVRTNRMFAQSLELPDDGVGRILWDLEPTRGDADLFRNAFDRVRRSTEPVVVESTSTNDLGESRHLLWTLTLLSESDRNGGFVVFAGMDVTQRRGVEQLLGFASDSARVTGLDFFRAMVKTLAATTRADFVGVFELHESGDRMRPFAQWPPSGPGAVGRGEVRVGATAAAAVVRSRSGAVTLKQGEFGVDQWLVERKAAVYFGASLTADDGRPSGVVELIFARPPSNVDMAKTALQVFAGRAAAEIDRLRMQRTALLRQSELSEVLRLG